MTGGPTFSFFVFMGVILNPESFLNGLLFTFSREQKDPCLLKKISHRDSPIMNNEKNKMRRTVYFTLYQAQFKM
jgi:hypothetical protein